MIEPLTFTRQADGTVTADNWPEEIEVEVGVVDLFDNDLVSLTDDVLVFNAANGKATYRVTEQRPEYESFFAELVEVVVA